MAYTYSQLVGLAQNAGFTGQSANTAAAIALAESSGNPGSINFNDPGGSYGLMQINQAAHPGTSLQALDPQGSFNLAYQISNGGTNFSPWSTYKSGAYQQYLTGETPPSSLPGDIPTGGDYGGLTPQQVTGAPAAAAANNALSQIGAFAGNWIVRGGIVVVGLVLVAAAAFHLAKPKAA